MKISILTGLLMAFLAVGAAAETITLIDGTKLSGEIVHVYRNEYSVRIDDKEAVIPRSKIASIEFALPEARAAYSTPEKTFRLWEQALRADDRRGFVECYALMYQGVVQNQMEAMTAESRTRLKDDMAATSFDVLDVTVKESKAVLKARRVFKDEKQTVTVNFVRENGEWKMTP